MQYVRNTLLSLVMLSLAAAIYYFNFYRDYTQLMAGTADHISVSDRLMVLMSFLLGIGISLLVFQPEYVPLGPPGPWRSLPTRLKLTFISSGCITVVMSFYSMYWLQTRFDNYVPPIDYSSQHTSPLTPAKQQEAIEQNEKIIADIEALLKERGLPEAAIQKTIEDTKTTMQNISPSDQTAILEGIYQNILTES